MAHRMPGSGTKKKTPARISKLLAAIGETANVKAACKRVGVSRSAAYAWRNEDEEFRRAWDTAMELGIAALEDEAARRAFEGFDEPVFYQGRRSAASSASTATPSPPSCSKRTRRRSTESAGRWSTPGI